MEGFDNFIRLFGLGPVASLLIVVVFLALKKMKKEHDEIWLWYVGKRAVEQEREKNDNVESNSD